MNCELCVCVGGSPLALGLLCSMTRQTRPEQQRGGAETAGSTHWDTEEDGGGCWCDERGGGRWCGGELAGCRRRVEEEEGDERGRRGDVLGLLKAASLWLLNNINTSTNSHPASEPANQPTSQIAKYKTK